ncbi:hypothetical protein OAT18_03375 [Tenacibaculum sp.]|nr:hypothetical protein [Tenacibaculum sp.]
MKKIIFLVTVFIGFQLYAQEISDVEKTETDEIIDSLLEENEITEDLIRSMSNFDFLYFSMSYNNKTYFSGRDVGIDQFNMSPQLTYMSSKGFFVGIAGLYYSEFTPNWDYFSVSTGYGKSFGKKDIFRWSISYARYFYSNEVDNPYENGVTFRIGVKNKKKTLGTQLSTTYLFGSDNTYQFTSTSYGVVKLFKDKNHQLKIRPQLEILVGKQVVELSRTITIGSHQITRYIENNEFGLINTQLSLPLQYSYKSFDFELGYNVNIPSALTGESNLKTTGFFNLSLAYMFDF